MAVVIPVRSREVDQSVMSFSRLRRRAGTNRAGLGAGDQGGRRAKPPI